LILSIVETIPKMTRAEPRTIVAIEH